ncbi:MAG: lycopene cyclase domain-containing protein, partial [Actinomycetota bacterium]
VARPDLRGPLVKISLVGAAAGLVSELWYYRDYWRPPTVLDATGRLGWPSPEDVLFGFTVAGVGFAANKVAFRRHLVEGAPRRYPHTAGLALAGLAALVVGTNLLGINSILVSSGAFVAAALVMAAVRRDLLRPALEAGALLVATVLPIYLVLFDVLAPRYWDRYWLLHGTALGVTVLGQIPVTEILWYTAWGAFAGIAYEFTTGRVPVTGSPAAAVRGR